MWFNRPAHDSYIPYGYGYSGFERPSARAIARERAAREREAVARRAEFIRWQQMQDAARSPYDSYLRDDGDSFISYPYDPRANDHITHEDLKRRRVIERQRQPELVHQAELSRRRGAERARESTEYTSKPEEPTSTSAPHFVVPISSPGEPPSETPHITPTQLPKYASPPPSPRPVIPEVTPEKIRAAMTIQDFYQNRMARRQALTSIAELSNQFEQFKAAFSPPPQLDYRGATPTDIITIPVTSESFVHASSIPPSPVDAEYTTETSKPGRGLAFTSNNKVVLEYVENLNQLVDKLDRIESGGHASVREQRKQMIRNVEAEAQRMDRWIATVWKLTQPPTQAQYKPRSGRQL